MELVLTDKGRADLEKEWDIDDMIHRKSGTWDYGEDNEEMYYPAKYLHFERKKWLIAIDTGVIGSGDYAFSSWDEFKEKYGTYGYTVVGQLLQEDYITIEDIPEEYL